MAVFQPLDGNLVTYKKDSKSPVWCSGEGSTKDGSYTFQLVSDGSMIINNTAFNFKTIKNAWKDYVTLGKTEVIK